MAKPTILAVDDDLAVLSAITRDRQRYYGRTYRILRAASRAAALDITYRIVQQHHGKIEVHSRAGETRFIVRLPIAQVSATVRALGPFQ